MNTLLCFLANLLVVIAIPALAVSATDLFAVLAVGAIFAFLAFDYAPTRSKRPRPLLPSTG